MQTFKTNVCSLSCKTKYLSVHRLQQQCDTTFLQFFLASMFMFSPGVKVKTSGNFCKTFSPANTTWKYVCRITLAVSNLPLFLSSVNFVIKCHYTRSILSFFFYLLSRRYIFKRNINCFNNLNSTLKNIFFRSNLRLFSKVTRFWLLYYYFLLFLSTRVMSFDTKLCIKTSIPTVS